MPSNTYDLVVLGDDFAGLVAATLVARRGQRVLLVVTGTPSTYKLGPYTLPARALALTGMEFGAVRRVLDSLHFQHPLKRRLVDRGPSFQLATSSHRLDVWDDQDSLARELQRESTNPEQLINAAAQAVSLAGLLDPLFAQDLSIPPAGFFDRREIARVESALCDKADAWWRELAAPPLGRALFSAPAALATSTPDSAASAVARLRAFSTWQQGAPRLQGDWRTLRELFLDKLDSHGGDVRIAQPTELVFGWGSKVTGVHLDDGDEIGASQVLAAMPIADLEAIAGKQSKKLQGLSDRIDLAGHRYVMNMVVDEAGVPEGMGATVMYIEDPDQPLVGSNAVLLQVSEPDQDAHVAITASAVCPMSNDRSLSRAFADLRMSMRKSIEELMPFVTDHVLVAHSPNERLPAEGLEGEFELDEALPPEPLWCSNIESHLQLSALPYQVGLKNLTLCNTQVLPGLGLEGEFAVGWQAAIHVLTGAGKRKDTGRSVLGGR